ncbi:hypothetical protein, partial [Angustibacter aerolatus]
DAVDGDAGPARATPVSPSVLPGGGAGVLLTDEARAAAASTADVASVAADPEHAVLAGHKVYTVQKPDGRYHDNLWDIAERHLGDGRRYKEIYQLNEGREQPDGRRLELSRLIQPGWQLIMPDDATGLHRAAVHHEARSSSALREVAEADAAAAHAQGAAFHLEDSSPATSDGAAGGSSAGSTAASDDALVGGLTGGGLLAAGLLATLWRSRRRPGTDVDDEQSLATEAALRVGADLDRARGVDATLRRLAEACAAEDLPLPGVFAVRVESARVELLLAPARDRAPHGWEVVGDGYCWATELDPADAASASTPAPFPSLVSVGRDGDGRDVMLVLDAATGPVTLTGDPATVADVGVAMAVSLATSPWGRDLTVGVHGLPADVLALAPERFEPVDDAAAVTAALAEAVEQRHAGDGVLSGGARREGGRLLVLATDPGREALAPLLTAGGRQASGVLVAAEVPGATWRLHVDEAGTVDIAPLDLRVTGYRLDEPTVSALASLLTAARDEPAAPVPTGTRFTVPPVDAMVDDATWLAAPNRIDLLGAPQARATGALDPSRIPLATEVVAFLAVHREGVHPTVLGGALWPRGVTPDVRDATVARVRDWLGDDERGGALLRELPDGRLQLSSDVPSDWDVVRTLALRARDERDPAKEADLLRRALRVVRGPLLTGAPQGRYSWVVRTRLERTVPELVVALAHRMAELLHDDDPAGAQSAAASGLRMAPREQLLWRDVLRAAHARDLTDPSGGAALLPAAVHRLRSVLADLDVPLESETEALIEELEPGLLAREA